MFVITLGDIIALGTLVLLILISAVVWAAQAWQRWFCPHTNARENRRCHAICTNCGKDLGFIQNWRDAHKS